MEQKVQRYHELKQLMKDMEMVLSELRGDILNYCQDLGVTEVDVGDYKIKSIQQQRKEYDDGKLYEALPDSEVWRLISKADAQKVAGLVKLNVIPEAKLAGTYSVKNITLLQVDKK